jgi:hypothetical protein
MTVMHILAILFSAAGLLAAIEAAYYSWKASRVTIETPAASISDVPQLHNMSGDIAFNRSCTLTPVPRC